jgi:hypothetical protein
MSGQRLIVVVVCAVLVVLAGCAPQQEQPEQESSSTEEVQEPTQEPVEDPEVDAVSEEERLASQQNLLLDAFTAFKAKNYEQAISAYEEFLENAVETDSAEEIRNAFSRLITSYLESKSEGYQEKLDTLYAKFSRLTKLPSVEGVAAELERQRKVFRFGSISELRGKYKWQELEQDLLFIDVKTGDGPLIESGDLISCYYTLWNSSGKKLQTNVGGGAFSTVIDAGRLIKGWDLAVPGMRVGGIRRLIVPGNLAYGENPPDGSIKVNETLVFELQVTNVVK